jgi:hypothetical protein
LNKIKTNIYTVEPTFREPPQYKMLFFLILDKFSVVLSQKYHGWKIVRLSLLSFGRDTLAVMGFENAFFGLKNASKSCNYCAFEVRQKPKIDIVANKYFIDNQLIM